MSPPDDPSDPPRPESRSGSGTTSASELSEAPTREPASSGLRITIAIVVVLLIGMGAVAVVGWQRADQWQRRAEDRAVVVRDLQDRVTTTETELTALEDRLDALASEKAGTEDEREAAQLNAEQLEELVRQAGLVATDLDTCARGAVDTVNLVNSLGEYDLAQVNEFVVEVQRVCSQALAANDALQQTIEGMETAPVGDDDPTEGVEPATPGSGEPATPDVGSDDGGG